MLKVLAPGGRKVLDPRKLCNIHCTTQSIPMARKSIWRILMEPQYTLPKSHNKQHSTSTSTTAHSKSQHSSKPTNTVAPSILVRLPQGRRVGNSWCSAWQGETQHHSAQHSTAQNSTAQHSSKPPNTVTAILARLQRALNF